MNMKPKKLIIMHKSAGVSLLMALLLILSINPVKAQKAPEYSNDFLMDDQMLYFFMADRLEFNVNSGLNPIVLDAQGYIGKDVNKLWFEAGGEARTAKTGGEVELEGLYGRAITAYFDARAGIRYDIAYTADDTQTRGFGVVGIQGLAPYLFEVDGNVFISEDGDVSAELEGEYDFPITQRLWGQPRFATSVAAQDVEKWSVGSEIGRASCRERRRM